MISETEDWNPPPFAAAVRNPGLRREWAARVAEWEQANLEISAAWSEALVLEESREDARALKANQESHLRFTGLPERAIDVWRQGLNLTPSVEAVRKLLASDKTFLLMLGSWGCGKTSASAEALVDGGQFARAVVLSRMSAYDKDDRRTWGTVCDASVLVLDDLGAEQLHDAWKPMLDELIDVRYGSRQKTIITTNLDADLFRARYGERIADRIRHDGFIETCGDTSLRRRP